MNRIVWLFSICLVVLSGNALHGQQAQIKILANSTEVTGTLALRGTQRLTFVVSDGRPANAGYAYEFGPLQIIPANGTPVTLKPTSVENRPVWVYSLRSTLLQNYPQGFILRLGGVIRHNPDHSTDTLPFSNAQLQITVTP